MQNRLLRMFDAAVASRGDDVSLYTESGQYTYTRLNQEADLLASRLREYRTGRLAVVAARVPLSADTVVCLLASLKCGAIYVPVDHTSPDQRLSALVQAARATVIVERPAQSEGISGAGEKLDVRAAGPLDRPQRPVRSPQGDDFSILFTSGSVGEPKGVYIGEESIAHFIDWVTQKHPFRRGDVNLIHRSPSLIASMWDILTALLHGVPSLIVPADRTRDIVAFWHLVTSAGVTHLSGSPSLWRAVLDHAAVAPSPWRTLRSILSTGEAMSFRLASELRARFPGATMLNIYGLTECARPFAFDVSGESSLNGHVSIGRPLPGVSIAIVSDVGRAVGIDEPGELWIGGQCVTRGYLDVLEDNDRFVAGSPGVGSGSAMFRTGDIAIERHDGNLEIVGRMGRQLNIRGYRIAPEEVETALQGCSGVADAVVVAEGQSDAVVLTAYVTRAGSGPAITGPELRATLKTILPEHLVPTRFRFVQTLPRTVSGKRSWRDAALVTRSKPASKRKRDSTLDVVCRVWKDVLDNTAIGPESDFHEAGGHSLAAMRIASRLLRSVKVEVPLAEFYAHTTPRALSEYIERLHRAQQMPSHE